MALRISDDAQEKIERIAEMYTDYGQWPSIASRVYHHRYGVEISSDYFTKVWKAQSSDIPVLGGSRRIPKSVLEKVCEEAKGDANKVIQILGISTLKFRKLRQEYGLEAPTVPKETSQKSRMSHSTRYRVNGNIRGENGKKYPKF